MCIRNVKGRPLEHRSLRVILVISCLALLPGASGASETVCERGWSAGIAKTDITPTIPMWLAGYGSRDRPSDGTVHPIWIKALSLTDATGTRCILVTSDLCGMPKWLYESICVRVKANHGLSRSQIRLTNSHNHCAPVVRGELEDYYPLDEEQRRRMDSYSSWLEEAFVTTIANALSDPEPVVVSTGEGHCGFAVNRRKNREADVPLIRAQGKHLKGRVDHSVPVLAVRNMDHSLLAVVFGYACHNTTLSSYQWSGDYAGFAQLTIEKHHPEAQAMFVLGCGGDQNPLPRRTIALAEQYGRELSAAVMEVLKKPMQTQKPRIRTAFQFVQLDFESTITKQTLLADRDSPRVIKSRWARRMLRQLVSGVPFKTSYPYATQVWMLGDQLWIALGGEALVGYSHRFKAEYGKSTWVTGYFADLTAYIPTRSDWEEGGYEVDFLYEYMLPAERWAGDLETRIADAIEDQVQNVSKE